MSAIIDSAPSCVANVAGAKPADDSADFIIQAAYEKCAGIMTFGPGTTYGDEGSGAATSYYVLTWIGIAFMVAVLVAWVLFENRRLVGHVARLRDTSRAADVVE
jgi:cytochrome oxidase assembly protein ShyY1